MSHTRGARVAADGNNGTSAGPQVDVFALGAVLYEMLAGRPAYPAVTPVALVEQHRLPTPPLESVSPGLAAIAVAAMHRDPQLRIPTADELGAALSDKHRQFADIFLMNGLNARAAGRALEYKNAAEGPRLKRRPDVQPSQRQAAGRYSEGRGSGHRSERGH